MSSKRRVPVVAIGYAVLLIGARVWLDTRSAAQRRQIWAASSTNVQHLERDPWRVIPESAIWAQRFPWLWVVAVVLCLGVLEIMRGPLVTAGIGVAGHVIGTLVSELVVAIRIAVGDLPSSARHLLDIGPSYVVGACGFALIALPATRWRWRLLAGAALLPVAAQTLEGVVTGEVDAIGHLVAAVVGVGAGLLLAWHDRRGASSAADSGSVAA